MPRILTPATALAALLLTTLAAAAQNHPTTIYCLVSGGDDSSHNCSYRTVEDCNQARTGSGGTCVAYTIQR